MNDSSNEITEFFPQHRLFALLLSPLIVVTNLAVVVSSKLLLCSSKRPPMCIVEESRKISLILLGNLALADIALAVFIPLRHVLPELHRDVVGCIVQKGATVACTLTSMCCIALIAVDRYFFIVHSIRYDHYMTEYRARNLVNLSWALGILFGFVPVTVKGLFKNEQDIHCRFVTSDNIDIMLIAGGFAFPLLVTTFALYMAVYFKARTVSKSSFQKTGVQRLKTRSVLVVFLSSSCFLVTWGPYLVSLMIYGCMCGGNVSSERAEMCRTLEGLMSSPFPMLGFFNSLMNPIIFAWWHRPFTRALFDIFCPGRARRIAQARSMDISTIVTNT